MLAALSGAVTTAGLVLGVAELTRRAPQPGTPAGRRAVATRFAGTGKRSALGAAVGLLILALTRWPVAALAVAAAVAMMPSMSASKDARQRTVVAVPGA